MSFFELFKTDPKSRARLGRMNTTRGPIDTPVFMPVGTQASVLVFNKTYAGTWSAGDHGGMLHGVIRKQD